MENLIIKYLTDSISTEELSLLKDWLKSSENQDTFKSIVQANQKLDFIYRKSIDPSIAYSILEKTIPKERAVYKMSYKAIFKYAAIALILLTVYFGAQTVLKSDLIKDDLITLEIHDGIKYNLEENGATEIKSKQGVVIAYFENNKLIYSNSNNYKPEHHQLTVPNGKIFSVVLSDGTAVSINSGSTIKYFSTVFDSKARYVYLNGEAYFDVTKNKELPFIVRTNNMNVKVLGTKFNVSSYRDNINPSVFLEEGSVGLTKANEVFNSEKSLIIKPNQRVVLENERFSIYEEVSSEKYIAWRKRQLLFKNDRFEDIVKRLERFYNLSIEFDSNSLKDNRYTGKFSTESISEVLDVFKELSYFKYIIKGNTVTITGLKK